MSDRLEGRFLLEDAINPSTGEVVWFATEQFDDDGNKIANSGVVTKAGAKAIVAAGIEKIQIRSILTCRSRHGVCKKCYGSNLATNKAVTVGEAVGIIAAQSIGEPGTQLTMRTFHTGGIANAEDITQGLPRVEELFEARRPKRAGIVCEISGTIRLGEDKRNTVVYVTDNENKDERKYVIPYDYHLRSNVFDGAEINKGDSITEGAVSPQDVLAVMGPDAVQDYIIAQIQSAYRLQGVDINDKHIEVIVRQMMRKVRILDNGSTNLLPGTLVDRGEVYAQNDEIEARIAAGEEGLSVAVYEPTLLGITKASLATESFLSAASFQETTRVLTDAAIHGKVDPLFGLKENVIIGKLVPAGTGLSNFESDDSAEQSTYDYDASFSENLDDTLTQE